MEDRMMGKYPPDGDPWDGALADATVAAGGGSPEEEAEYWSSLGRWSDPGESVQAVEFDAVMAAEVILAQGEMNRLEAKGLAGGGKYRQLKQFVEDGIEPPSPPRGAPTP